VGHLWVQQQYQQPHDWARALVYVLLSINPSAHGRQKIYPPLQRFHSVSSDETGVYESNKQQVRENEIDMLTI